MDLYEFMDEFLPRIKEDGYKHSIFLSNHDSAVVEVEVLIEDLRAELKKY